MSLGANSATHCNCGQCSKVMSNSACAGFCWEMQGEGFEVDLRLLKLGDVTWSSG